MPGGGDRLFYSLAGRIGFHGDGFRGDIYRYFRGRLLVGNRFGDGVGTAVTGDTGDFQGDGHGNRFSARL